MLAKIEKLVPGGQGLATLEDGKKAFIWNALPDETVEFNIAKNKRSYCEGVAYHILNASEHRIEPKDACYLATSPWQIMDYQYELTQKSELVRECFFRNSMSPSDQTTLKPMAKIFIIATKWNIHSTGIMTIIKFILPSMSAVRIAKSRLNKVALSVLKSGQKQPKSLISSMPNMPRRVLTNRF